MCQVGLKPNCQDGGESQLRRDGEKQELIDAMSAVTAAMLLEAPNEVKKKKEEEERKKKTWVLGI